MDYLGFYWTLPVNWAGFTDLPREADAAAAASRTIRYQRDRIRRWVHEEKGNLLAEAVFMDSRPDRGTDAIRDDIARLLAEAETRDATLLLVDFTQAFGWRPHGPLYDLIGASPRCLMLTPDPVMIDGRLFDPARHFRQWRALDSAYRETKEAQLLAVGQTMADLRARGASHAAIAAGLNETGLKTANGRAWSAETVRKFLARL